jgi:hypothetical protein
MGDRYLRKLLVVGACATLRHRKGHTDALRLWADGMLERKTVKHKFKLTAVALANKVARIVFALLTRAAATRSGRRRPERQLGKINGVRCQAFAIEGDEGVMRTNGKGSEARFSASTAISA